MNNAADAPSVGSDVVIVAGNTAYPEYLDYQAYVGHPNRPFRQEVQRMAFYKSQVIQPEIPEILDVRLALDFSEATVRNLYATGSPADRDVADLIQVLLEESNRTAGSSFDVVLLSTPDDPRTFKLDKPIGNTKRNRRGGPTPITMGQYRYTSIELLRSQPRTTDELNL